MNVSPLDLREQRFRKALRGYNKIEVTSFLLAVADDYEQALHETDRLRQEVARLEGALSQHRDDERSLQSTLITAHKLSDDIKASAELEAQRIVRDAQSRSAILLEKAQARLEDLQHEIDGLRLKRRDVETSLGATIQTLQHALEHVREQDERSRDDRILLHRPRNVESLDGRAADSQDAKGR
ncbi:MAG: DivIVA domain-containing protein [Luteitalea sp.]|nr:DivIVA domain-containing protein [Luteitalea sp.]